MRGVQAVDVEVFYFLVGICCLLFYLVVGSKLFVFVSWHLEDGILYFTTWYLVFLILNKV